MSVLYGTVDLSRIRALLGVHVRNDRLDEENIFVSPGLDGDSAFEFIGAFASEFRIDMATYFWPLYHHDEAEMMMARWQARLWRKARPFSRPDPDRLFLPVSVGHLTDVALVRSWWAPNVLPEERPWPALWRTAARWFSLDGKDVR